MNQQTSSMKLQEEINERFVRHFGPTPVEERIADIERQASKVTRYIDTASLQEAAGDLLCSVLQLANEHQWDVPSLVAESLERIDGRHEIYAELGRRLKIGILAGAFDPVHLGHIELTNIALDSGVVDEVWWMPCYSHLAGKRMASPQQRLEMCEAAAKDISRVRVFDFEIRHQFLGETYHLARKLLADESFASRNVLHLIFGRDNSDSMHSGSNFAGLQRLMPVIVIPRGDLPSPPADAWYRQKPHCYIEQRASNFATSSTEVRRRLTAGDPTAASLLPDKVFDYVRENKLYDAERAGHRKAEGGKKRRVAAMIGSFDPPTTAQVELVETLLSTGYESVKIFPAASRRDGQVIEHADSVHRAALIDLTFGGRPRVEIDFRGLEDERAVAPATLQRAIESDDLWFVVPEDAVAGLSNSSDLRNNWHDGRRLWNEAGFVILSEPGKSHADDALPPRHELVPLANVRHPAELREKLALDIDVSQFIPDVAASYIQRHRLFQAVRPKLRWPVFWQNPRVRLVYDSRNEKASRLADRYRRWEASDAELILVIGGDGTMLHAIREYWRLRLPFIGINAGHLGFLMNQKPFDTLETLTAFSYRMPMLRTIVKTASGEEQKHLAFSDAWIERQTGQAAWLRLDVNEETRVPKIVGDGLLVATPSGSSSYARAMGATPVPLDNQSLTIAGSNIFRPRFWQSLMMPADARIQITTLDRSGKRPVSAFVDGVPAGPADSMQVSCSSIAAIELAFTGDSDLSAKLLASLLPHEPDRF